MGLHQWIRFIEKIFQIARILETTSKTNVKWDVLIVYMYERSARRLTSSRSGMWLHDLC